MSKLRKLAKGQPCMVRIPHVCNYDPATTVLAHYRLSGISGIGMKSPDEIGAWCCSACHSAIDAGHADYSRDELKLYHAEGVFRTQAQLIKDGVI
jgi:hypothetical protein